MTHFNKFNDDLKNTGSILLSVLHEAGLQEVVKHHYF